LDGPALILLIACIVAAVILFRYKGLLKQPLPEKADTYDPGDLADMLARLSETHSRMLEISESRRSNESLENSADAEFRIDLDAWILLKTRDEERLGRLLESEDAARFEKLLEDWVTIKRDVAAATDGTQHLTDLREWYFKRESLSPEAGDSLERFHAFYRELVSRTAEAARQIALVKGSSSPAN
jgi:hypothetical protein